MIDLHTHSTCSDGSESPARVVELAHGARCSAVALTDHDTLAGLGEAGARAAQLGIRFVPGCEVSSASDAVHVHLLAYFVDDGPGELRDELDRLAAERVARNEVLVERLGALGLPVSYEELLEEAGGRGAGRPHVAAILVRKGVVGSIPEAFDRYLARGRPGYVERRRPDSAAVIALAHRGGALVVLAHPHSVAAEHREQVVARLAAAGLDGLESYYGRYSPAERDALARLARRFDLVPTGGSDFHGDYKAGLAVGTGEGDLAVPASCLAELDERRSARLERG